MIMRTTDTQKESIGFTEVILMDIIQITIQTTISYFL